MRMGWQGKTVAAVVLPSFANVISVPSLLDRFTSTICLTLSTKSKNFLDLESPVSALTPSIQIPDRAKATIAMPADAFAFGKPRANLDRAREHVHPWLRWLTVPSAPLMDQRAPLRHPPLRPRRGLVLSGTKIIPARSMQRAGGVSAECLSSNFRREGQASMLGAAPSLAT
jgi:hypothetical protein